MSSVKSFFETVNFEFYNSQLSSSLFTSFTKWVNFISVFFFMISLWIPLSLERVVMIFLQSELWSSSFRDSIIPFTTKHDRLECGSRSWSLFSRRLITFWVISNWVSKNSALLSSAIILLFNSWYWPCSWFVLGVNSDSVVEYVSGVTKQPGELLYFDDGYHFLRS